MQSDDWHPVECERYAGFASKHAAYSGELRARACGPLPCVTHNAQPSSRISRPTASAACLACLACAVQVNLGSAQKKSQLASCKPISADSEACICLPPAGRGRLSCTRAQLGTWFSAVGSSPRSNSAFPPSATRTFFLGGSAANAGALLPDAPTSVRLYCARHLYHMLTCNDTYSTGLHCWQLAFYTLHTHPLGTAPAERTVESDRDA